MRPILLKFVAFAIVFALATGSALASLLSLNYDGLTATGSTSTDGTAIGNGTPFSVHAIFSDTTGAPATGGYIYQASAINFTVGGTPYSVAAGSVGNYIVALADPASGLGAWGALLIEQLTLGYLYPLYSTATPALDIIHPSATVFSDYLGSPASSITFLTAGGNLALTYDPGVGVNASITAVPEPDVWALMLIGSGGLIPWKLRRRAKASA